MKVNMYIFTGLMASISIILGVIENFIPTPFPAIRLGLSNVPILIMLYLAGANYAFLLAVLKSLIVPIFSANIIFKFSLSVPATMASFLAMFLVKIIFKERLSVVTVSVIGAAAHMITQIIIVSFSFIKGLIYTNNAGILLLSAVITGILMGMIAYKIINHKQIKEMFSKI